MACAQPTPALPHPAQSRSLLVSFGQSEAVEGVTREWYEVIEFGARLALGGPAIGAVIGVVGAFSLGYVINDVFVEVSLSVILAYCTFTLCEGTDIKVGLPATEAG